MTTAKDLLGHLRRRYQPPEWAFLDELRDGTGADTRRRFDAVALHCWPSGKYVRYGFEIKVSRGDFTKELEAHDKRAELEKHCHQVFFVVGPGVCTVREIPEPWGLLELQGTKLRCTRKPAHREVGPIHEPLAISAVRRLVEQDREYRQRHYVFGGAEVTQADIDALVLAKLEIEQDLIKRQQDQIRQDHAALSKERLEFQADAVGWWRVWNELKVAAGESTHWRVDPTKPPTTEQLFAVINRIRLTGRGRLADALTAARTQLDAAITALTTPAEEPTPNSSELTAQRILQSSPPIFQPKHGTAERWHVCDCDECKSAKRTVPSTGEGSET